MKLMTTKQAFKLPQTNWLSNFPSWHAI